VHDRETILTEIAEALPEIIRRLKGNRRLSSGEWELTVAQVRALGVVAHHADCTMGELARRLGISLSAATGLVDRLVQRGLIEREADSSDRRLVCLRLTAAAKRVPAAFRRQTRRRMAAALEQLSEPELQQIAEGLALLRMALGGSEEQQGGKTR
jgi:DNA-binding MarR family transcriptional regulator